MAITAEQVKELRERTGAGMMECKKALVTSGGDMESAIDELRKSGIAKADKKAGRVAAEGVIIILSATDNKSAVILEVNSETDFVARDTNFVSFAKKVAETALTNKTKTVEELAKTPLAGQKQTVEEARQALVATVGENIQIRRILFNQTDRGSIGSYVHSDRIGVLVELDIDNKELAKDIAMHIAANKPLVITPDNVPAETVQKEKEIFMAQAATSGKPPEIIEKMVGGRLKKFMDEVSLVGQPFVKDPDISVGTLLAKNQAKVLAFTRFAVGEGIEKPTENFVEAVMSQVQGS